MTTGDDNRPPPDDRDHQLGVEYNPALIAVAGCFLVLLVALVAYSAK